MDLQAEKIQLVKLILDTDDKSLLKAVRSVFKEATSQPKDITSKVADSIGSGMNEVKQHLDGKTELRSAKDLLNEL
ncbi:hypothetical protein LLH06_00880 [Mucilaginibacter daejeonensis]|uniref:hypothetical protein n=1 Tax=Mucilaginibacter daejeonensis TaxID=398049 RepID=UPI001D1761B6|nr:hypothetical protein [Mucilaginibacter daejeonensis]UEG53530.1 hypothetical protein LLH06_00880 [Mucilaginibacter daejeonensis]